MSLSGAGETRVFGGIQCDVMKHTLTFMMKRTCWVLTSLWTAHTFANLAYAWPGVVTRVTDGDTVWVQPLQGGDVHKVRLLASMPPRFAKLGASSRAMPCMLCCRAKRWRFWAITATPMDVCWPSCHAKATMWARGWWRKAMRGPTAIKICQGLTTRCNCRRKVSTGVCLQTRMP